MIKSIATCLKRRSYTDKICVIYDDIVYIKSLSYVHSAGYSLKAQFNENNEKQ